MKEPIRKLIVNLIDRVEIFEDKSVTVKVTFNNVQQKGADTPFII